MADAIDRALARLPDLLAVNALSVSCPKCGADPNKPCNARVGSISAADGSHNARHDAARDELRGVVKTLLER